MDNRLNGLDLPMGLGMALARNMDAMNHFSALPENEKRQIIEHTHTINSKKEMQAYVQSLTSANFQLF